MNATDLGPMQKYRAKGCLTFDEEYKLPEEFEPTGCGIFKGGGVEVELCLSVRF